MKYLYLSFLLFCVINATIANDDCCKFTIQYLISAQSSPSEEELVACFSNTDCDKRYYFAGKMINAYDNNDFVSTHEFFDKAMLAAKSIPVDDLSLQIIYLYAGYLELMGGRMVAGMYYSYLKEYSQPNTAIRFLSEIRYATIYESEDSQSSLIRNTVSKINSLPNIKTDDKISIILTSSSLASQQVPTELYLDNFFSYYNDEDSRLRKIFLGYAVFQVSDNFSTTAENIREITLQEDDFNSFNKKNNFWYKVLVFEAKKSGDYEAALRFSKKFLESEVGYFNNKTDLSNLLVKLKTIPLNSIFAYANSNLYQTRLGKGLPPVKNALDIYELALDQLLTYRLESVNLIVTEQSSNILDQRITPLIVGTYLHQNTNDLSFLSRSISLIDGFSSGGSQYWTLARKKMRTDKRFTTAIVREQALAEEMKYLAPGTTIEKIRQQQLAFEGHREQMSEDFSEFYEELTTGYKVNLQEVQEDLAVDTTGLVAFYQNENILYRLFIAPDTIDISVMNGSRAEVLKLTTELAETIPAGKSIAHTKEASRKLYQLLFAGLDSMLPGRMHIVTTGALEDVPFSALRRDTEDGAPRYLGMECAISRQSSIREMQLLEELDLDPRYAQPLGMAPDFSNEFLQASDLRQAGFKLPPLVFNTEEVRDLQNRSAGQYYYDATATINHYVQNASDYSIIHLATHAISSQTDGLRSHLYLLDDDGEPVQLYASDIGDQTLNANLVVLSACETGGGGRHINEGKVGLTKAYLAAGARSVVSSNWAVDDHATAELMGSFYERLENGDAPHEALQHSRRAYLERHPDAAPYKWAAFEAYGGMKPVNWDQQSNWWPSVGYGGAVAFFAVLLGAYFRRRDVNE